MRRAFQTLLCLLTALQLCGGHLGVAQMVAWVKMIHDYSSEKGLVEGVKETFDGEHPCAMCREIAEAKQEEQKQTPLPLEKTQGVSLSKWLALLPTLEIPEAPAGACDAVICFGDAETFGLRMEPQPAVPPPRVMV